MIQERLYGPRGRSMNGALGLVLVLAGLRLGARELSIRPVGAIGGNEARDTFFTISSAISGADRDIYVCDFGGSFLARFGADLAFRSRIGRQGAGPGDFASPRSLDLFRGRLYFWDLRNRRIASCDPDLGNLRYLRLRPGFYNNCFATAEGGYIGDLFSPKNGQGRVAVADSRGELVSTFHHEAPQHAESSSLAPKQRALLRSLTSVRLAIDRDHRRVLAGCRLASNPFSFCLYTTMGRLLRRISLALERHSPFPAFLAGEERDYPERAVVSSLDALQFWNDHYVAFLSQEELRRGKTVAENSLILVFDDEGRLAAQKTIPGSFRFFSISPEGVLLGKKWGEDEERLQVYRLQMSK